MNSSVESILQAIQGTHYAGQLWLVGGCVRDELLGLPEPTDIDIVTELEVEPLVEMLDKAGIAESLPVTYPRFGTAMVKIESIPVEFVRARKESYDADSRKPNVEPATLLDDARRRDFTCNSLLKNVTTGELFDPLGNGLDDLKSKVLRTPLDPALTFRDDPLRMLRAVRFRWKLRFEPAPGLYEAIRAESDRLKIISDERIRDELTKMLELPDADECLKDLMDLNLLHQFAPEFEEGVGMEQGDYHHLDVWDHSRLVVKNAGPEDRIVALAALFHDIAKPRCKSIDEAGRIRFFGHETVGAEMAKSILKRLKFSHEEADQVAKLVRHHMRLGSSPEFTATAARRLIRDLGQDLGALLRLIEADRDAHRPGMPTLDLGPIRERLEQVNASTPVETLDSPLSGDEIMAVLGVEPGEQVGRWKAFLCERVLEGDLIAGDKAGAERLLLEAFHKNVDRGPL
ncbi:MAG: HD domain-containing protein [Fimbriimonadaceae bacterium]|nr:HD domain-containing protein [Fimbriimonadaceae bacterium]